ncbi:MAG TPA: ATP-binding protein [Archangium sp.]|uniref:sensor histidine kinase n=1 Tax=Archangium sp. TaxID=1872627 RepID=UPI002E3375CB|nr:ATP-binding protein [Archangium sp.]HEX5748918.1 ATP-binding protein [Archangium sp.]
MRPAGAHTVGSPEGDGEVMNRRLVLWAVGTVVLTHALLVAHAWGRWTVVGALCGLFAVRAVLNTRFLSQVKRMGRLRREEQWALLLGNLTLSAVGSQLLHWSLMGWINMLVQAVFLNGGAPSRQGVTVRRVGLGLHLAASAGLGLREGVEAGTVGVFCLAACAFYGLGETRCQLLLDALEASRESHRRWERMQGQLVAHEKLSSLGMLAAGVAHEINNPMAFVTSNVRLLSRDLAAQGELPEELREYVEDVLPATLDGIRRVNAIVADLRRFARNDPEEPVEFDLNAEVSSALRLSQGERRGRCRMELELGALRPIVGQPRQMGQVVLNLIMNAVQALPEQGGVVKVSTREEPGEAVVEVRDNGVGMKQEVVGRLFQPFFTTKPVGEGTGLGLAVAYGIVTGHGGRIEVESEEGRGTCFTVRLPLREDVPPSLHPSPAGRGTG